MDDFVEQVARRRVLGILAVPVIPRPLRELLIVLAGIGFYFGGRGITESAYAPALDHARDVVAFEKTLGIYWEPTVQGLIDGSTWAVDAMNWVYIWGHWPVIAATLVWLVLRHPKVYRRTRNAMIVSGGIGMVIFVIYPLAPPRLAHLDLLDTVTLHSHAYRVLQPPGFTNQFAAMPSLHFGWDLLMGIALVTAAGHWLLRLVGYVLPLLMAAAVVLTANHYLVDVVAGGALALVGLYVATRIERKAAGDVVPIPRQAGPPVVETDDGRGFGHAASEQQA
ncbi:MAG: phosphatase PAP2 family protein [Actinomycetes bacterium]